jgi:hypothetical protein
MGTLAPMRLPTGTLVVGTFVVGLVAVSPALKHAEPPREGSSS